jgi:glycosyltransferase involved in cell wall biosynthesis
LFVGRLAPEKGVDILLGALEIQRGYGVDIVGSGPLADAVAAHRSTRCLGWLDRDGVSSRMAAAAYLLMPSICYESFSMVIVEAFASGLPVIASRLGTMAEIVEHERTGLLFEPGSAAALAAAIRWAEANPDAMRAMGQNARREYESKYTPETNYRQLMAIYADALAACHSEEDVR